MAFQIMSHKVLVYGISDIGLVRKNNEDAWKVLQDEHLYLLADGMGGHQAGEIASTSCINFLSTIFLEKYNPNLSLEETKTFLFQLIQEVNSLIHQQANENNQFKGMGTTLCCILIHTDGLIYAHVGDSRIYRYRDHHLDQLTNDDSLLRELIDLGQISEQQAEDFHYKNIITKAIGTEANVKPTVKHLPIQEGDIYLMCTDGLSDLLSPSEIANILSTHSPENVIPHLVEQAKLKGGFDNITLVLLKV